jgi:hypothetical protein
MCPMSAMISIDVPEDVWATAGDPDPLARLIVPLSVAGQCSLHLEARQVVVEDGQTVFVEFPEDLDALYALYTPDGEFETYQAFGREYVLFAVPYGT